MMKLNQDITKRIIEEAPFIVLIYKEKVIYANSFASKLFGQRLEGLNEEELKDILLFKKDRKRLYFRCLKKDMGQFKLFFGFETTESEFLLRYSPCIVMVLDEKGIIKYESPSVKEVLGYEERIGKSIISYVHSEDRAYLQRALRIVFKRPGSKFSLEYRERDSLGEWKNIEADIYLPKEWKELKPEGAIFLERDITKKKSIERSVQRMSSSDLLTNLPRQRWLIESLNAEILKEKEGYIALLLLDISEFGNLNIVYGIKTGDHLLRQVAERLRGINPTASRLFADDFGMFERIRSINQINDIMDKIRKLFIKPFRLNGSEIKLNFQLGISIYPFDGKNSEELLKKAEIALFKAKKIGENAICLYSPEIEKDVLEKEIIRNSFERALEERQFKIYYQPICNLSTKEVVGFEALVRWIHPELGFMNPDRFIPFAEKSNFILRLGEFILDSGIADIIRLQKRFGRKFFVGINFSTKQFLDKALVDTIVHYIEKHNLDYSDLVLEITERTAMEDPERTKLILNEIRKKGIRIAIDDFGTAYSSLEYLIDFDVDKIKIDKKFVSQMFENEKAMTVVKMTIGLCKSLKIVSVAEGIETEEQFFKLRDMGCKEGQGFYFSHPLPLNKIEESFCEK